MSALTVVETDLDCEGGKEEMFVQSQFSISTSQSQKKKQKKSNPGIESNRHPGWNEVVRSRTLGDDPTRSVDDDDDRRRRPTTMTRAMNDEDISLHPSRAFHPSKSIRASAYASGVRRANEIRRSAYLQSASSTNRTRRRRRAPRATRCARTQRNETKRNEFISIDDVPEPWSP